MSLVRRVESTAVTTTSSCLLVVPRAGRKLHEDRLALGVTNLNLKTRFKGCAMRLNILRHV